MTGYLFCSGFAACSGKAAGFNFSAFKQERSSPMQPAADALQQSKPKKKKRHRCEKCMLVVFDTVNVPSPVDHSAWLKVDKDSYVNQLSSGRVWQSFFVQDLIWDNQSGPKCAAASVSSLALSFASAYGLSR